MARVNRAIKTSSDSIIEKYITFQGKEGKFFYKDSDTSERVYLPNPFRFLVLDETVSAEGFTNDDVRMYSNEIRNQDTDEICVRTESGQILKQGLWRNIKKDLIGTGVKYTINLYATTNGNDVVKIQIRKTALGGWFDFTGSMEHGKYYDMAISCKESKEVRNSKGTYRVPVFVPVTTITPETEKKATLTQKKVIDYVDSLVNGTPMRSSVSPTPSPFNAPPVEQTQDDLPF